MTLILSSYVLITKPKMYLLQDTVEIYLVCVVFYGCILVPLQVYAACRQVSHIHRDNCQQFKEHILREIFGGLFRYVQ